MALNDKQRRFVEEYLVDLNAKQAYIRAGYTAKNADVHGSALMQNPEVAAAIAEAQAARSARTEITQDMVLQRWWGIATADANDLVQFRRTCCRYCWGLDHAYQWTEREYERACAAVEGTKKPKPDGIGGFGFDRIRDANPDCPECRGEGVGTAHVKDTRHLTGSARLLYAGVKEGRDGLEVKLLDQGAALSNVARHLGMFPSKVELTGKDGGPIQTAATIIPGDLAGMSDDELTRVYREATAPEGQK